MPGKKRASEGGEVDSPARSARSNKKAKVESNLKAENGSKGKGSKKPSISSEKFLGDALPLHFNMTHTPPSTSDKPASKEGPSAADPGVIGHITALPTQFSTGSLGWKGSKKLTIELKNSDGETESVQVMLNINATVLGTKPGKGKGEGKGSKKVDSKEESEALKEAAEEALEEDDASDD